MKVLVLGSGLLGDTTAYELGKRGMQVTVLERKPGCAAETSFANGGQLSYSHAEPWASPSVLPKVFKWMFRSDAPLVLRPRADWQMIRWSLEFLANCTNKRAAQNCINMLRLGMYSRECMNKIRNDSGIDFDFLDKGILHIYSTEKDFDAAKRHNDFQAKYGCSQRVLTAGEALAIEPALAHTPRKIVGGIHANLDESGDAYKYCTAITKVAAERHGVKFLYNTTIKKILTDNNGVAAVSTDQGDMTADIYVMAMGSYSSVHLREIGIDIPVYPMKGYSITIPSNEFSPKLSITDGTHKVVYSHLGSRLRVAGTAEFAGYNHDIKEQRIIPIVRAAKELFPKAVWDKEISKWACLRPSTPDGPPIMGKTPYRNLFLNTGHGTLGWTQAAGSAFIVSDIIEGKQPAIAMDGLTLEKR